MIKIGRNELCPCGSGKKYKRCCLGKPAEAVETLPEAVGSWTGLTDKPSATKRESKPEPKLTIPRLRKLAEKDMAWAADSHKEVGLQLIEAMRAEYDNTIVQDALELWNGYSRVTKPAVKKPGAFLAAIEFYYSETYGFGLEKAKLAAKYDITAGTLTRRYQEFARHIEEFGEGPVDYELLDALESAPESEEDARLKARLLASHAENISSGKLRRRLAETALQLDPECAGAYLVLAEEADEAEAAGELLVKGMDVARRALGEPFFKRNKGHFWLLTETRPYMMLCSSYAEARWYAGDTKEAARMMEHMLELNPGDNLGARYLLLPVYIHDRKWSEADRLLQQYGKDDITATFAYDRMLMEYQRNGVTPKLNKLFREARETNRHVPDYLFGTKRLPSVVPSAVGFGDVNEAIEYVVRHTRLWAGMSDLIQWMREQA